MKIINKIKSAMSLDDTPERLALAFAIGVFVAFTPIVGLHTISVIFLAWVFRLNKIVSVIGSNISNPYTLIPLYAASIWCGSVLLGQKMGLDLDWGNLSLNTFLIQVKPLLIPLVIGSIVLGIISSVGSYFIFYYGVRRYKKFKK